MCRSYSSHQGQSFLLAAAAGRDRGGGLHPFPLSQLGLCGNQRCLSGMHSIVGGGDCSRGEVATVYARHS
jgi:hypothetical protein